MVGDSWSVVNDYFVVSSLLVLCVVLVGRSSRLNKRLGRTGRIALNSPAHLSREIVTGVILAVVLILCLVGVNSMNGDVGKASINIALLVMLAGDLTILWDVVKRHRQRKG